MVQLSHEHLVFHSFVPASHLRHLLISKAGHELFEADLYPLVSLAQLDTDKRIFALVIFNPPYQLCFIPISLVFKFGRVFQRRDLITKCLDLHVAFVEELVIGRELFPRLILHTLSTRPCLVLYHCLHGCAHRFRYLRIQVGHVLKLSVKLLTRPMLRVKHFFIYAILSIAIWRAHTLSSLPRCHSLVIFCRLP